MESALIQEHRSGDKQYGKDGSLVSIESVFAEEISGLTGGIDYSRLRKAEKRAIGDYGRIDLDEIDVGSVNVSERHVLDKNVG